MCHGALGSQLAVVDVAVRESWAALLGEETLVDNALALQTAPQSSGNYARPP